MTTPTPLPIRLAQTLGITTSLLLAGSTLSTSLTTIPRLLESPAGLLLKQWSHMYETGSKTGPPAAAISTSAFIYLAVKAYISPAIFNSGPAGSAVGGGRVWLFSLAGILSAGIVPYTFAVIRPVNQRLWRKVEVTRMLGKEYWEERMDSERTQRSAHQLVDWWGVLNLGRGLMLTASGLLGVWAALG